MGSKGVVMGNAIRQSRRRPRVRSVSFLSLWWLIARVATFELLRMGLTEAGERWLIHSVMRWPLAECRGRTRYQRLHNSQRGNL
jgi:hypothetical protein